MNPTLRQAWAGAITLLLLSASPAFAEAPRLDHGFVAQGIDTVEVSRSGGTIIGWEVPKELPPPLETTRGRADLYQHASLSFAIGLAVGVATEEPAAAAGVSITFGVGKEIFDERFDKTDLLADLVGAGLAALVTHWLEP
ncbi:MAG TPA: hypothetical protein VFQ05_17655 [Candidatus Eisenbacteria bacterium]|nr:hypothetical protein [Candidatus Eisenbacteria bacterium]